MRTFWPYDAFDREKTNAEIGRDHMQRQFDLLLVNGTVVTGKGMSRADVGVKG